MAIRLTKKYADEHPEEAREEMLQLLHRQAGNIQEAARESGLCRMVFYRRLHQLKMTNEPRVIAEWYANRYRLP